MMKLIYALLVLASVTLTASSQSVVSPKTAGFTLQITANHEQGHSLQWDFANTAESSLKDGSRVVIAVRKTNISNHEITKMPLAGWIWDVRDSSGNPVGPNNSQNQNGPIRSSGPAMVRGTKDTVLQPGEATLHWTAVSRFDLSQPGTYTFQVVEHISDDPKSTVVKSNTIRITVLPADSNSPTSP